jgi:hypothetical protein
MKKVIFSAVAMIAFVGSSMANTSEIKLEKIELEEIATDCRKYAAAAVKVETLAAEQPMTQSEFAAAYTSYYNFCVDANNSGAVPLLPVVIKK